jgi:hypothetical protein
MTEPKPLASLSGSLLARKGAARPAMRPQVQRLAVEQIHASAHLDDLGWDDMGEAHEQHARHDVLPLTPVPVTPEAKQETEAEDRAAAAQLAQNARRMSEKAKPEVVRQQETLAHKLEATRVEAIAPVERKPETPRAEKVRAPRAATRSGRRAAFTLRLDEQRHLKLRLASTILGRSAQQLVTKALDKMLDEMPELELLAAQVKRGGSDSAN